MMYIYLNFLVVVAGTLYSINYAQLVLNALNMFTKNII
jgi:hypothetical protein